MYAQVAGATVAANGYAWDLSNAPDAGPISGQGTYHLHFQWNDFSDPQNLTHSDTINLQTTNTDQSHQSETFHFAVYEHGSNDPAWSPNSSRPTPPIFPLLVPPDAVQAEQATVDAQYYNLGEATGEVMTHFTLPAYHPAVDPLQLDYSSLAANPRPIFTEYYQLSLPITATSTVTATLKLNGVSQGTSTYDTHLLNDGDILAIALQGDATSLSTGRYPYEIDVTENTTVEPTQTGAVDMVNSAASLFGAGWSLDNLEHLWIQGTCSSPTGAFLELPGGQSLWFAYNAGSFVMPGGDFSTLTSSGSCPASVTYTRTLNDGTQITFNSGGY